MRPPNEIAQYLCHELRPWLTKCGQRAQAAFLVLQAKVGELVIERDFLAKAFDR